MAKTIVCFRNKKIRGSNTRPQIAN